MHTLVATLIEVCVLLGILALTLILTRPFRRGTGEPTVCSKHARRGFWQTVVVPLAVLALSGLVYRLLALPCFLGRFFLSEYSRHFEAWMIFWTVAAVLAGMEGCGEVFCRWHGGSFPVPDLLRHILRGILLTAAAFIILNKVLGYNISALLTSTALLTAVVGFALQGVLGNLLAGMSLNLVRSVVPGDWIAVEGAEGEVIQINWRETRLRSTGGHIFIVPNSKVADAVVHNMTRPNGPRRHKLDVGASYSDAPGEVIEALVTAARSVPKVLRNPPPTAYVTEYKDFGINYQLRFWSEQYYDRVPVEGEVARMIWYQFKRRGIEIPFPMSDKLLNDFMEVVYHQRRMPPSEAEAERRLNDLAGSEFITRVLVDNDGLPLLSREELASLTPLVRHVKFTGGETIFRQGESGDACYVLTHGEVSGQIEYEGVAEPVRFKVRPGGVFGEMSLMTGMPRTATLVAEGEVELLEIPQKAFTRLLGLRPEIPERLAALVAERAAKNAAALENLRHHSEMNLKQAIQQDSILKRFLRLLGRG